MRCSECAALAYMSQTQCLPYIAGFIVAGDRCPRIPTDLRSEAARLRHTAGAVADALDKAAEMREREESRSDVLEDKGFSHVPTAGDTQDVRAVWL